MRERALFSSSRVIQNWSKWNHGFAPKRGSYGNQHKVTQVSLMLKLPYYTKSGVVLSKTSFLANPSWMGGPN